jgi:hypothetical protein
MTSYPAATHEEQIRLPSTPPPSTATGRDEMSGAAHAPSDTLAMNRVCCWRYVAGTDNVNLQDDCSVFLRVDIVLCVGIGVLRYCEEVQRAGVKVDVLRRPLETCLVDKDISVKVSIEKLSVLALLRTPLYHRYIKLWSSRTFVRDASIPTLFRSNPNIVIVTETQSWQ